MYDISKVCLVCILYNNNLYKYVKNTLNDNIAKTVLCDHDLLFLYVKSLKR